MAGLLRRDQSAQIGICGRGLWLLLRGTKRIADPAAHAKAMEKPIFSGPQIGEKLRSFQAVGLRGPDKGKEYDPVARAGDDMQLLLFTKGTSGGRIVPLLSRQLGAIMKGSGKEWTRL